MSNKFIAPKHLTKSMDIIDSDNDIGTCLQILSNNKGKSDKKVDQADGQSVKLSNKIIVSSWIGDNL